MEDQYQKYRELVDTLNKFAEAYYKNDVPLVGDDTYDQLYQDLIVMETQYGFHDEDSPTQRVGDGSYTHFNKVKHHVPLLSLSDVFSPEDAIKFIQRTQADQFSAELKMDGLALNLYYEYGILKQAATRGNGQIGEDVTANAKAIWNIPLELGFRGASIEVHGEVVIPLANLSDTDLSNARNVAAGTLRSKDPDLVRERGLMFYAYSVHDIDGGKYAYLHSTQLSFAESLGFTVVEHRTISANPEEFLDFYDYILAKRDRLPFAIDGLVIKVNDLQLQKQMGNTAKVPRWAVAVKFPPKSGITKITDVVVQVGRTGLLTPVAILTPVNVTGSTISKCSLSNFTKAAAYHIGDVVEVYKAGDVIPMLGAVISSDNKEEDLILPPKVCPCCGGPVEKQGDVNYFCTNPDCPEKILSAVKFAWKETGIKGLGDASIKQLVEQKLVKSLDDIYALTPEQFATVIKDKKRVARLYDTLHPKV